MWELGVDKLLVQGGASGMVASNCDDSDKQQLGTTEEGGYE